MTLYSRVISYSSSRGTPSPSPSLRDHAPSAGAGQPDAIERHVKLGVVDTNKDVSQNPQRTHVRGEVDAKEPTDTHILAPSRSLKWRRRRVGGVLVHVQRINSTSNVCVW